MPFVPGGGRGKDGKHGTPWNKGMSMKFPNKEMLEAQIEAYFQDCDKRKVAYTMSGLAYYLGTTRAVILDYSAKEEYGEIIARARSRCERFVEEMLLSGKNPIGAIFNLKNNYGKWKEETSTEIKGITSLVALIKSTQPEQLQPGENTVYAELESLRVKELPAEDSK